MPVKVEEITAPDGEKAVCWWPSEVEQSTSSGLWVVLPGGMTTGDAFYIHDTVRSGLFEGDDYCVFHNPGIVNTVQYRSPAALTDTTYLEHFLETHVKQKGQYKTVSLIGFSAGSMLCIAMSKRAEQINSANAEAGSAERSLVRCGIGIHGPDRIRDAFEDMESHAIRLDILFSYSLFKTMVGSGCTRFLPEHAGGGLHNRWWEPLAGWSWMKQYTGSTFRQKWEDMEAHLWSCRKDMLAPMAIPVFRVLALNDPIISYEECIDEALFPNLSRVRLQTAGGHCAAFRYDQTLARDLRAWRKGALGGERPPRG